MGECRRSVQVVYALPDRQRVVDIEWPADGLTAQAALQLSGLLAEFPEILAQPLVLGIHGVVCEPDRPLRAGDRVEVYRPLLADPRARRREQVASMPRKGWKR